MIRCLYCNLDFIKTGKQRKFCSNKCRTRFNTASWRKNNPGKDSKQKRIYSLRTKYGITLQEYNNLFQKQSGCCAICKKHQTDLIKTFHIDHNHKTGEIRGLLCQQCNHAIGLLKDDSEIIASALEYVN